MALGDALGSRQINMESGAASYFALHHDVSAALLHDAVHGGEAEAGALTFLLGGEERLENSRLGLLVHAAAGVADGKQNVVAGTDESLAAAMILVDENVFRFDRELSAVGHGVLGV